MIGAAMLGFMKSFYIAKLLSVTHFGAYSAIILIASYGIYLLQLGVDMGYLRIGALLNGKGYQSQKKHISNQTFTFILLTGILVSVVNYLISIASTFPKVYGLVGLLITGLALFNFASTALRINQKLTSFSFFLFLRMLISTICIFVFQREISIYTIVLIEILSYLILTTIILIKENIKLAFPNRYFMKRILLHGLPFSMNNLLNNLSTNSDQWMISQLSSSFLFGQYSFLMITFTIGKGIMNIVGQSINPQILNDFGNKKEIGSVIQKVEKYIGRLAILGFPVILIVYCASGKLIEWYYPNYISVNTSIPFVLIGVVFYVLNLYPIIFVVLNKGKTELLYSLLSALLFVVSTTIGLLFYPSLLFFAISFACIRFLVFILYYVRIQKLKRLNLALN